MVLILSLVVLHTALVIDMIPLHLLLQIDGGHYLNHANATPVRPTSFFYLFKIILFVIITKFSPTLLSLIQNVQVVKFELE